MKKYISILAITAQFLCAVDLKPTILEETIPNETLQENKFSPTLLWLETKEKNFQRDFYINEFLKTDINKNEALHALSLISDMNQELFVNFANKFKHDETKAVATCLKMQTKQLLDSYADCIAIGLTLKKATTLSSIENDLIKQKVQEKYPALAKKLKVISASIPFTKLIVSKKEDFYDIYLNVDNMFRDRYFNYKLPSRTLKKISSDIPKFNKFIQRTLLSDSLKNMNKSFENLDLKNLDFDTIFLLALNKIAQKDINKAYEYLNTANNKSQKQEQIDKVLLWKYLITKDEAFLNALSTSPSLNFYSLYSNELLNKKITFDKNKFIIPYEEIFKDLDTKEKAFYYAIIKTKSNFNEKQITKNFKVGAFSLDKKTIKEISIILNENYDLYKQFFIENNFKYANAYIKTLEKELNPILHLSKYNKESLNDSFLYEKDELKRLYELERSLFKKDEYKKFAINYFVYYNLLKKEKEERIKFSSIFQNLKKSDQTLDEKELK